MKALRLMTFNVQLLPVIAGVSAGTGKRAQAVLSLIPNTAVTRLHGPKQLPQNFSRLPLPNDPI